MDEKLDQTPEHVPAELALIGSAQAALFEDPTRLLNMSDRELAEFDAEVMRALGGWMPQMRRRVGLMAWVQWHRMPEGRYAGWLQDTAELVGVDPETIRRWRRAACKAQGLSGPTVAALRAQERKGAGQAGGPDKMSEPSPPQDPEPVEPPSATVEPAAETATEPGPATEEPTKAVDLMAALEASLAPFKVPSTQVVKPDPDQRPVTLCPECGATKYTDEPCPERHTADLLAEARGGTDAERAVNHTPTAPCQVCLQPKPVDEECGPCVESGRVAVRVRLTEHAPPAPVVDPTRAEVSNLLSFLEALDPATIGPAMTVDEVRTVSRFSSALAQARAEAEGARLMPGRPEPPKVKRGHAPGCTCLGCADTKPKPKR